MDVLDLKSLIGERVFVYFNLHTKLWSVRSARTQIVIMHCKYIKLKNATFSVGEKGRQRVNFEMQKNVHAGVRGVIVDYIPVGSEETFSLSLSEAQAITYDPYTYTKFVVKESGIPLIPQAVLGADLVEMLATPKASVFAKGITYGLDSIETLAPEYISKLASRLNTLRLR
jgi:hypothetical protein